MTVCDYENVGSHDDKVHQSGCEPCRSRAWSAHVQPFIMVGTVPGGHNDTYGSRKYKYQSTFDKGLDAYKEARDEGLAPEATTVAAVEQAREQVKSQERAIKKMGISKDELKTVAGVN